MKQLTNNKSGFTYYIIFWLSQSVSQLGSAMTGFALIIWAYKQTDSAMAVSLMTFCSYVPYILVSLFAGSFIDRHRKKTIMLAADSAAAVCTVFVWMLLINGRLDIRYIYVVNAVTGFMNAFQFPAQSVAVGMLVPKELYARASGMDSFSSNLLTVVTPVLAASVSSFWGLEGVILADLGSFVFAFCVLLFFVRIPEECSREKKKEKPFAGLKEGIGFLKKEKGLGFMIFSMALINFFSRLTYENILSPMLLARSGGNEQIMGLVSSVMGMGGIAGGLFGCNREDKGKTGEDDLSVRRFFLPVRGFWDRHGQGCLELVPGRACGKRSYSLCSRRTAYYSVSPGSPGDTGKNFCSKKCAAVLQHPGGPSAGRLAGRLCI